MAKKILILAGTHFQIPVIQYAKRQGHYVITCDNRPDNPGHKLSDEYINISTTDLEGVLKAAENRKIDGILAYGSDPAALTAAYVSEKLSLPGNAFNSVALLSDKGLFRKFLKENGFPVPAFRVFESYDDSVSFYRGLRKNTFIKPVDSSGSKGVTMLKLGQDLKAAFNNAMEFSRKGQVIIEEEIEKNGPHLHGEAFVYKGQIVFIFLGDQYFSPVNNCAPMSTTVPSMYHTDIMPEIQDQLTEIVKLSGFNTGGLNIEIIRDKKDNLYFIEIGGRNGGNFMPELVSIATGFKMAEANVNSCLNEPPDLSFTSVFEGFCTQLILHSHSNGIFSGYNLGNQFDNNIIFRKEYFSNGDFVHGYTDSRFVMGVFLYKFNDINLCRKFINKIKTKSLIFLKDS